MRLGKTAAFLAAALAVAGCGERAEPLGRLPPEYPVTVRGAADEPVVVRERPERVVALDLGSADLVAALGGARLVGRPVDPRPGGGGAAEQVVRASGQVDVDAIVRLAPDLIVTRPGFDPLDVRRAGAESGAAVYVQPDRSVEDVERAVLELGFLLGSPVKARRLVQSMEEDVARTDARLEGVPRVRVFVDTGFLIPASERSLVADLVRRARGELVAGDERGEPLGPCAVAALRPEVVLRVLDRFEPPAPAIRFDACPVRSPRPRVEALPAELVAVPGPDVADALAAVARALHPDAFR